MRLPSTEKLFAITARARSPCMYMTFSKHFYRRDQAECEETELELASILPAADAGLYFFVWVATAASWLRECMSMQGEHHYLGGRFVPPEVRDKYMLRLPAYPGSSMCVKLDAQAPQETPAVHLMGRAAADDDCLLDDQAATQVCAWSYLYLPLFFCNSCFGMQHRPAGYMMSSKREDTTV